MARTRTRLGIAAAGVALAFAAGCAPTHVFAPARPVGAGRTEFGVALQGHRLPLNARTPLDPAPKEHLATGEFMVRHGFSSTGDILVRVGGGGGALGYKESLAGEQLAAAAAGVVRARADEAVDAKGQPLSAFLLETELAGPVAWSPRRWIQLTLQPRASLLYVLGYVGGAFQEPPPRFVRATVGADVGVTVHAAPDISMAVFGGLSSGPLNLGTRFDATAPAWHVGATLQVIALPVD